MILLLISCSKPVVVPPKSTLETSPATETETVVPPQKPFVLPRGHASNPVWSKDGRKIAFEINDYAEKIDLFVAEWSDDKLQNHRHLTASVSSSTFSESDGIAYNPVWHPSGSVVFESRNQNTYNRLLWDSLDPRPPRGLIKVSVLQQNISHTSLSPDGESVLFVSDTTGNGDIYRWILREQKLESIILSEEPELFPQESVSGSIAYTRKIDGGEDIFVHNGKESVVWAAGNGDQTRPVWAGETLLFFSNERDHAEWDLLAATAPQEITTIATHVRLPIRSKPAISHDSQWVVYGLEGPEQSTQIWLTKLDGSQTLEITTDHTACGEPSIVERDGKILLAYTALPNAGSSWRKLYWTDITESIRKP
ncbi:MAG: hypothetical protein VX278_03775 [Myxococcota bacterium]|nr:hypothetical protein [Myxococcota bacterium]